MNAGGL